MVNTYFFIYEKSLDEEPICLKVEQHTEKGEYNVWKIVKVIKGLYTVGGLVRVSAISDSMVFGDTFLIRKIFEEAK